jgi:hypothetical protein
MRSLSLMTRRDPRTRDAETLIVLSERDIEDMLADAFVEMREVTRDDETAAACVDIAHERLTDGWYFETDEQ